MKNLKKGWYWPILIVGLLIGGGVGPNLILLAFATGDPSFSVEPDYYRKGLRWDDHLAQQRRNAALGWTLGVELGPETPTGWVTLTARLSDRAGTAVDGATVELEAFPNARASDVVKVALERVGEGAYLAQFPAIRRGLWEFRFVIRRGDDVFTRTVQEDVWAGI